MQCAPGHRLRWRPQPRHANRLHNDFVVISLCVRHGPLGLVPQEVVPELNSHVAVEVLCYLLHVVDSRCKSKFCSCRRRRGRPPDMIQVVGTLLWTGVREFRASRAWIGFSRFYLNLWSGHPVSDVAPEMSSFWQPPARSEK